MWNLASFEKLKSDWNQTWVIDATWEPSLVDKIKSYISRSKVIWGQIVRWEMRIHLTYFFQMKDHCQKFIMHGYWAIDLLLHKLKTTKIGRPLWDRCPYFILISRQNEECSVGYFTWFLLVWVPLYQYVESAFLQVTRKFELK